MTTGPALNVVTPLADARMRRSRAALRQAFLTLIDSRPFADISVRDIVAEAGVGYATFFRHFPSKTAMLDEIAADEIEQLVEMTAPMIYNEGTRASTLALCTKVNEHRALWTALLTGGAAGVVREEFSRVSRNVAAKRTLAPSSWLPMELGLSVGVSTAIEVLAWWLRSEDPAPVERVAEILDRLAVTPTMGEQL
jgi:AcrR family transcriptional regulator